MKHSVNRRVVALNCEQARRPLERAGAISGLVSEEALAGERLGRLTDRVAAALLKADLFSIRLPQEDGGLGGTGVELFEATEEIARADGSAGWCMLISNAVGTFVHTGADSKARREVFGNGPVACWATLLPKAKSVEVERRGFACRATLPGAQAARWHVGCWLPSRSAIVMANNGSALTCSRRRMSRSRRIRGR